MTWLDPVRSALQLMLQGEYRAARAIVKTTQHDTSLLSIEWTISTILGMPTKPCKPLLQHLRSETRSYLERGCPVDTRVLEHLFSQVSVPVHFDGVAFDYRAGMGGL